MNRRCPFIVTFPAVVILSACQQPTPWDISIDEQPGEQPWAESESPHEATATRDGQTGMRYGADRDPPAESGQDEAEVSREPIELSLESAVFQALANNRDLAVQQLEPVIAGTFEDLERAQFDPTVFAEAALSRERAEQVSRATGERFSVQGQDNRFNVGISQLLPTGTDVELGLWHDRMYSDRTPNQHSVRAGVSVTQSLLRGFNRDVNLANIRLAELDTLASEYELRGFTEALVADVEQTYWDYVLAVRELEIFESGLDLARQQLDVADQRIEVGVLPEAERAAAQVEVALREQDLIDARSEVEQIRLRLIRLIHPREQGQWRRPVETADEPGVEPAELDNMADHVAVAMQYRPELHEARLRLEQGRLEVVQTRNGLLPRLDLFMTLGKSGFADSFSSAARDVDGPAYDFTVGVRLEQVLGRRGQEADHRRARLQRQQAARSLENLQQLIEADVRSAYVEVERLVNQIDASRTTRELQEEALRAEMEKFEAGTSTALLVAQAQRDYLDRQIDEVRAQVSYRQALIDMYRLEGSLLERRALSVPRGEVDQSG